MNGGKSVLVSNGQVVRVVTGTLVSLMVKKKSGNMEFVRVNRQCGGIRVNKRW